MGCSSAMNVSFCMVLCGRFFILTLRSGLRRGTVKVPGVGAVDASPKPWLKNLSKVPHVEFEKKEHAAIAASWPVASDPAKRNASAAPMYPLYLEDVHRMVVGLVGQVEALTVEMGSVKEFESEVSLVMGDFKRLSSALSKLENLDKLPEICKSLVEVAGVLGRLSDLGASQPEMVEVAKDSGGQKYVS